MAEDRFRVQDNPAKDRFEAQTEHGTALLTYLRAEGKMYLLHTEVPPPLEGKGLGSSLARHGLEAARAEGLRVVPSCPFVAAYVERHPEFAELVAGD